MKPGRRRRRRRRTRRHLRPTKLPTIMPTTNNNNDKWGIQHEPNMFDIMCKSEQALTLCALATASELFLNNSILTFYGEANKHSHSCFAFITLCFRLLFPPWSILQFFSLSFFFSLIYLSFSFLFLRTLTANDKPEVFFIRVEGKTHARRNTDVVESDETPESYQFGEKAEFHSFVMPSMWRDIASASITSETHNNRNKRRRKNNNSKWRKRSE